MIVAPAPLPVPSVEAQAVAQRSTRAVEFLSRYLGPFPYSSLAVTQMPGRLSQGWPGLIFLSSYAFLNVRRTGKSAPQPLRKAALRRFSGRPRDRPSMVGRCGAVEELPRRVALRSARQLLRAAGAGAGQAGASSTPSCNNIARTWRGNGTKGRSMKDAGPVTLGHRLTSSRLPEAYEVVVYGRGTWLIHMVREMFRDADREECKSRCALPAGPAQPARAFRRARDVHAGLAESHGRRSAQLAAL